MSKVCQSDRQCRRKRAWVVAILPHGAAPDGLGSVSQETEHVDRRQLFPAMEKAEFEDKSAADQFSPRLFHEVATGTHGSTSRQDIVNEQHASGPRESVGMDLERIRA